VHRFAGNLPALVAAIIRNRVCLIRRYLQLLVVKRTGTPVRESLTFTAQLRCRELAALSGNLAGTDVHIRELKADIATAGRLSYWRVG